MPNLDKGQHGRVPIVLERSFADVQYSANVSHVLFGDFWLCVEYLTFLKRASSLVEEKGVR